MKYCNETAVEFFERVCPLDEPVKVTAIVEEAKKLGISSAVVLRERDNLGAVGEMFFVSKKRDGIWHWTRLSVDQEADIIMSRFYGIHKSEAKGCGA